MILPWANWKDVEHDVANEVRACIQFVFARTVHEVLDAGLDVACYRGMRQTRIRLLKAGFRGWAKS